MGPVLRSTITVSVLGLPVLVISKPNELCSLTQDMVSQRLFPHRGPESTTTPRAV